MLKYISIIFTNFPYNQRVEIIEDVFNSREKDSIGHFMILVEIEYWSWELSDNVIGTTL
jgi:hypothetical protein